MKKITKQNKDIRITVRFSLEEATALKTLAKEKNISISDLIREYLLK